MSISRRTDCTSDGCDGKYYSKDLCHYHYRKKHKAENPEMYVEHYRHPLLVTWKSMIQRTTNVNHPDYKNYGGRGLTVCDAWQGKDGFDNFLRDMGEKPSTSHTLDRRDNNKDYEPGNCHWTDRTTQVVNRRMLSNNTTGYTGVYVTRYSYLAKLKLRGEIKLSKNFKSLDDAIAARKQAEEKYFKPLLS